MFYSSYILTKKGPLAKVWLAAHWEKKLTKNEVQLVDLNETVVHILQPSVPISCRTQGELLLGCVRIYANKVALLLKESSEATLLLTKKPTKAAPVEMLLEDNIQAKDKALTIPVAGLGFDYDKVPELASFDATDIFLPSGAGRALAEETFLPDDWFQQTSEFVQTSQLPPGMQPDEIFSPTPSAKPGRESIQEARQQQLPGDDLVPFEPVDDADFANRFLPGAKSETTPGTGGVGMDAPDVPSTTHEPTPATEKPEPEPKKAPQLKQIKMINSETQIDPKIIKKALNSSHLLVREFVPLPASDEELRCRQDQQVGADELLLTVDPMRKRKIDVAFGDMSYRLGYSDPMEDPKRPRLSVFAEKISKAFAHLAESSGKDASSYSGLLGGATPATTTHAATELPFEPLPEFPQDDMAIPPPYMASPGAHVSSGLDPTVSAKETLKTLKQKMKTSAPLPFSELAPITATKAQAAAKFMDMLVLSSKGHIDLAQSKPYAGISLTKGVNFNEAVTADGE